MSNFPWEEGFPLYGYTLSQSIRLGDPINVYCSSKSPFSAEVFRLPDDSTPVFSPPLRCNPNGRGYPIDAFANGCDWHRNAKDSKDLKDDSDQTINPAPPSVSIDTAKFPKSILPGVFIVRLSTLPMVPPHPGPGLGEGVRWSFDIPIVVRPSIGTQKKRILYQLPTATWHAYNEWGGGSLYYVYDIFGKHLWGDGHRNAPIISTCRPFAHSHWRPSGPSEHDYFKYDRAFIDWLEGSEFATEVDYCTSADLYLEPDLLSGYQLFLSAGHDEYWTLEARNQVEAFTQSRNAAFFGGNTCWWQFRFESDGRTADPNDLAIAATDGVRRLVCYKAYLTDPVKDPRLTTTNWFATPLLRFENTLTGVSFRNGATFLGAPGTSKAPFVVQQRANTDYDWVLIDPHTQKALPAGFEFGVYDKDGSILDDETDAALVENVGGVLTPTGKDHTPLNFQVLASATFRDDWKSECKTNQTNQATMGIFQNARGGIVFNAATTGWALGLTHENVTANATVANITRNVIKGLAKL